MSDPRLRAPDTEEADTPLRTQGQRSRSKESMIDESQARIGSRDQVLGPQLGPLHCHLTTKSQSGSAGPGHLSRRFVTLSVTTHVYQTPRTPLPHSHSFPEARASFSHSHCFPTSSDANLPHSHLLSNITTSARNKESSCSLCHLLMSFLFESVSVTLCSVTALLCCLLV